MFASAKKQNLVRSRRSGRYRSNPVVVLKETEQTHRRFNVILFYFILVRKQMKRNSVTEIGPISPGYKYCLCERGYKYSTILMAWMLNTAQIVLITLKE